MNFGEYIKELRNDKALSQRELSEKSGVSNAEISRIESGERKKPSPHALKALAPFLGVSYEQLLQKAGYISEIVDHKGFTENIYRDQAGNLIDILTQAKAIHERDEDWARISYRVASENLSQDQLDIIKANTTLLLEQFLKNNKK